MADTIDLRLKQMGIVLPTSPPAVANYVPFAQYGGLIQLAGSAPSENGRYVYVGQVGRDLSVEQGMAAARLCALNLLATLRVACEGDLNRVRQFIMVRGFVHADTAFEHVPAVINGASDLIVSVFGPEIGRHARTSVGCAALPFRVAVEVDALVEIDRG